MAIEKCPGKQSFLKCAKILKDYKSKRNLERGAFLTKITVPQSATLSKKKLHGKYFLTNLSTF